MCVVTATSTTTEEMTALPKPEGNDVTNATDDTSDQQVNDRTAYFRRHLTPPELDPRTAKALWRDLSFLLLGCIAVSIISFVESHASEAEARMSVSIAGIFQVDKMPVNPHGIVDTGYLLTHPLYEWLKDNRDWNDLLAAINSIVLVIPSLYITYITVWVGDYSVVFRVLAVQLLRAFCGWFTYLPPDPTYLNSNYDFPDFVHCIFQECSQEKAPPAIPFVSFFSGHVATMVVVGNHMWLSGYYKRASVLIHTLNVLQIVRLLATRGHYSIDMIIGWYVAVYVSNPAGRLGRYYSRGATVHDFFPKTPQEAFETVTGVNDARLERRMSALMQRPEFQSALKALEQEEERDNSMNGTFQSETTARILQETAAKMMQEQACVIQEQVSYLQEQARRQAAVVMATDPTLQKGHNGEGKKSQ